MRKVDQEKGRLPFRLAGDAAHQAQHRDHPWAAAERRGEGEDPGGQRGADSGVGQLPARKNVRLALQNGVIM